MFKYLGMEKFQPVLEQLRMKSKDSIRNAFVMDVNVDLRDFSRILKEKLNVVAATKNIDYLFHQLDPYGKGYINSSALENYLQYYEDRRSKKSEGPFNSTPTIHSGVTSQDSIFDWALYSDTEDSSDEINGHYVSLSRVGLIGIWRKDLMKRFEKSVAVASDANITPMATGLACIPHYKLIAVATASGDIRFFSSSIYKFEHKLSILWLPSIVVSLCCHNSEKLFCGDFSGEVFEISLSKTFFLKLRRRTEHIGPQLVSLDDIKKGQVLGLKIKLTEKSHFSPVVKVKYVPSIRALISCSVFVKRSMIIHYLEENKSLSFSTESGVTCFDFCERLNYIVTGSADHSLRIWNPVLSKSCSETLTGHASSILHVAVDDKRLILVSIDRFNNMRVWDLIKPVCLQLLKFRDRDFPKKRDFSSIFLDSDVGHLILTTNRVGMLKFYEPVREKNANSNSDLILLVGYSAPFDCLVTVGSDSSVAVWNIETNELINELDKIHEKENKYGLIETIKLTSAALDPTGKRLITAGRDGSIKIWNFYLGVCLRSFHAEFRVLSLTSEGFNIFAGGSHGRIINFYDDGNTNLEGSEWKRLHKQSVISMSCCTTNILATASCDGEIVVWLWKNGDVRLHMLDETNAESIEDEVESGYLAKSEVNKRKRCGISQVLYLFSRPMEHSVGNLVSCGADGKIRFWNAISTNKVNQWRLLSTFKAVFRPYDAVLCIETDKDNTVLLSGDTQGYLRTYDLQDYYSSFGSMPSNARESNQRHMNYYPFLHMQKLIEKNHQKYLKFDPDGGAELGYAPLLLNCYRAHVGSILKITYCNEHSMFITAGRKGSIRLWTLAGEFLRELGQFEEMQKQLEGPTKKHHLPTDIKAVASSLTLQVLNGGRKPLWERGIQAIRKSRLVYEPEELKEIPFKCMEQKEIRQREMEKPVDWNLKSELEKRLNFKNEFFNYFLRAQDKSL